MKTGLNNDQFVVFQRGTFQYLASVGQQLELPHIEATVGSTFDFDEVLLVANKGEALIGTPLIEGGKVSVTIVDHKKTPKQKGFKFKAKSRYRRTYGFRQDVTIVEITSIASKAWGSFKGGAKAEAKPEATVTKAKTAKPAAKKPAKPAKKAPARKKASAKK